MPFPVKNARLILEKVLLGKKKARCRGATRQSGSWGFEPQMGLGPILSLAEPEHLRPRSALQNGCLRMIPQTGVTHNGTFYKATCRKCSTTTFFGEREVSLRKAIYSVLQKGAHSLRRPRNKQEGQNLFGCFHEI